MRHTLEDEKGGRGRGSDNKKRLYLEYLSEWKSKNVNYVSAKTLMKKIITNTDKGSSLLHR
jgi:hypothetical protein